jgi:hypothetical protein
MRARVPTEAEEQYLLARWLDANKVAWCHVPNGGYRNKVTASLLKRQGVKRGVPDILIFDAPAGRCGIAVELKRQTGGRVSPSQAIWHERLRNRDWVVIVAHGADDAISQLLDITGMSWRCVVG